MRHGVLMRKCLHTGACHVDVVPHVPRGPLTRTGCVCVCVAASTRSQSQKKNKNHKFGEAWNVYPVGSIPNRKLSQVRSRLRVNGGPVIVTTCTQLSQLLLTCGKNRQTNQNRCSIRMFYRSTLWLRAFNTDVVTRVDMCRACTKRVGCVAVLTKSGLNMCNVWTEAFRCSALWTRTLSQVWTCCCVKHVPSIA